ncbi:MAG: DUF418 domain-containing protein [Ideonella sp. WA131b]|nr:DUF418 domain-containing protein [Ideonella sp. WA131b]
MSRGVREPLPDALRALALLGVLVVNAAVYLSSPWGALLGDAAARAGGAARLLQGLCAFLVQGKAYPILAFLFGMSLAMALASRPQAEALERARSRQRWLLVLGVLHGVFIYFGDILTMYALIGGLVLRHATAPWGRLRRVLRRALIWALVVGAVAAVVVLAGLAWAPAADLGADAEPNFTDVASWPEFWRLNAEGYLFIQVGTLFIGFALLRLLMLAGVAAARLRWLTHRRWEQQRLQLLRRWAWPALVLNAVYGLGYVVFGGDRAALGMVELLGFSVGPLLSMVMVTALAQHARHARWPQALAPLGQRTLTLYVGHGLFCVLLFSGVGLGLQPGPFGLLAFALLLWAAAGLAAHTSGKRRWPLEAWMAWAIRR